MFNSGQSSAQMSLLYSVGKKKLNSNVHGDSEKLGQVYCLNSSVNFTPMFVILSPLSPEMICTSHFDYTVTLPCEVE